MIIATALTCIWAARLSFHIWYRHKSEDYRYKEMREGWEEKGGGPGSFGYYIRAYGFVYLMQGIFSLINASSLYFINLWSIGGDNDLYPTDYIGIALWVLGFAIEVLSDC